MTAASSEIDQKIWHVVMMIPPGKVATYGDVAQQAGLPGGARRVGRALRGLPEGTRIPWHRVVNAQGSIVIPGGDAAQAVQRVKLEAEGVEFRAATRLELQRYRWLPG